MDNKPKISINASDRDLELCFLEHVLGYKWTHVKDDVSNERILLNKEEYITAINEWKWKDGIGENNEDGTSIDEEYATHNLDFIIQLLENTFERGFRWRNDNGFLECYKDYDYPSITIDHKDFRLACVFALLKVNGITIIQ